MTIRLYATTAALLAVGGLALPAARAEIKLPPIYGDHMVLQQGKELRIAGTATPGEAVTVSIAGRQASGKAGERGEWTVALSALPVGVQPTELSVAGDGHSFTFKDVLVGDVWVCSGQSNMEFPAYRASTAAAALASADLPLVRFFVVPHRIAFQPVDDAPGRWIVCTPENLRRSNFSAVGYFFGKEISDARKLPVGLIGTYWGGTPAQAWTSVEALRAHPALVRYADKVTQTGGSLEELKTRYEREILPAWQQEHNAWQAEFGQDYSLLVNQWRQDSAKATAAGQPPPPLPKPPKPEPIKPVFVGQNPLTPSVLYNGMIAPLTGYAIKGAVWYQGEANAGAAEEYAELFKTMITDWRQRWHVGDFPFLFVQLAGYGNGGTWPVLRESQRQALSLPGTGMAVALDVGEEKDIHPRNKEAVGHRLAVAARHVAYGEDVVCSGPTFERTESKGDKLEVRFGSVGGGLTTGTFPATGAGALPTPAATGGVEGFEVAGADGKFVPARAEISGEATVVVSAEGVASPGAVRYGWAACPGVNLYNKEGLPAVPFSSAR